MLTIKEIQEDIIAEFEGFDDWMDRYSYIIDMGNELAPMPEELKTPDNLIEGCQSRMWLAATCDADGIVTFSADSDAIIVKGIASLLLRVLSGQKASDILEADLFFIDAIGLHDHLSPTRSNGLASMVKQIKTYALAFSAK